MSAKITVDQIVSHLAYEISATEKAGPIGNSPTSKKYEEGYLQAMRDLYSWVKGRSIK